MTKIAVTISSVEAAFINTPSDFSALRDQLSQDGTDASEIALSAPSLKAWAKASVANLAEEYRSKLATQSAGKLAEYRIKEEIARNPDGASDAELALISREAKARGTNRTGLIAQIKAQAAGYRQIALLIGALEAEAGAAISVIPDDAPDIEAQIMALLVGAKSEAEAEYQNALALMAGG